MLGDSGTPKTGPGLVGQFWELDSDRILKLVLREIILSQEIQMPPGGRRAMGHRLHQFLPFGWITDSDDSKRHVGKGSENRFSKVPDGRSGQGLGHVGIVVRSPLYECSDDGVRIGAVPENLSALCSLYNMY